jgi:hypothetical protein
MYTANLSENLKKSDQQSKRVTIRFDLPNQSLRRIFQALSYVNVKGLMHVATR